MSRFTGLGAVFRREFKSYFSSPLGYVFIVIFLVASGYLTVSRDFGRFLVDDMIWFSPWWDKADALVRLQNSFDEVQKSPLGGRPANIINQLLRLRLFPRFDVEFDVRISPWWVVGEAAALERAITNLLDNAAKWSPPGETVLVTLNEGTLMVADRGPGIAAHDLPHVFERFYRSAESRGMSGSGLGLSIVRSVAERHGGIVRAGTGPGGGAGFWLSIPGQSSPPEGASD